MEAGVIRMLNVSRADKGVLCRVTLKKRNAMINSTWNGLGLSSGPTIDLQNDILSQLALYIAKTRRTSPNVS